MSWLCGCGTGAAASAGAASPVGWTSVISLAVAAREASLLSGWPAETGDVPRINATIKTAAKDSAHRDGVLRFASRARPIGRWAPCESEFVAGVPGAVVWRFLRNRNVMRMTLPHAGR